ncbi:YdcF family protein [Gemmiger sp.]
MTKLQSKVGVILLNIAAAALVVYSVSLIFLSNFNMGNLMVWLLTICVVGYAAFRRPLNAWFASGTGRVVFWVLAVLATVYLALIAFVAVSGYMHPPTGNEQVVIVLGAGLHKDKPSKLLQYRLDKAYEFAAAHPDTLVVTSGGQGRDEWVPEGDAMRDYLIAKGLAPERVVSEARSTSTEENFAFSLEILRARGYDETTPVVYVSNEFHCYRAGRYAAKAGFTDVTELAAGTPLRSLLPCYLREALALLYYWVFKTSATGPMHAMVGLLDMNKKFFYK